MGHRQKANANGGISYNAVHINALEHSTEKKLDQVPRRPRTQGAASLLHKVLRQSLLQALDRKRRPSLKTCPQGTTEKLFVKVVWKRSTEKGTKSRGAHTGSIRRLLRKILWQRLLVVLFKTQVVVTRSQGALVIRYRDIDVGSAVKLGRRQGRRATTAILSQRTLGRQAGDGSGWRRRSRRWRQRRAVLELGAGEWTVVVVERLELGRRGRGGDGR